ncbi:MAG: hypothetical protein OXH06_03910 [Gemmatimonadetes bacterium]|nr:hypothetical protein [Gemmatimonadota bacterium]
MLETGFGVQDFTPVEPSDGAFRVYDPISFRVLILRHGDTNVTFLAGDCFSIEEDIMVRVRERVGDIVWLDPNHILPCASHVGTTPILFQSYVSIPCEALKYYGREDFFADNMAAAIREAAHAMAPSRMGVGAGSAPNVLYNRRSYDGDGKLVMSNFKFPYPRPELTYAEVDDNVYVIRIDDTEGNPSHCAIVFGCHALCSTDKYGHISADYPGVARRVVESAGVNALFLPGSIGNVVPVSRAGRTCERVGNSVGGAALYALEQAGMYDSGNLRVTRKTIKVPTFAHEDPDAVETELKATPNRSDGLQRFQAYGSRHYATGRQFLDYTITRVSACGVNIVHLPGEIFVETASAIRAAAQGVLTIVLSGPTADVGYLSTPEAHREGGMEPRYAGLAVDGERLIRDAACELVAD